jgi:hypothetical protein
MFYYVADDVTGPYKQQGNYALMAYQQGWITPGYFCSFYPTDAHGMLVNHQVVAPGGGTIGGDYVAPLKRALVSEDLELRLAYWEGNGALKGKELALGAGMSMHTGQGAVVEGTVMLPAGGSLGFTSCDGAAYHTVSVNGSTLAMTISAGTKVLEHVDRLLKAITAGATNAVNFTVLQRHGMYEFYLGGFLAVPERLPRTGCIKLVSGGGLKIERAWNMTSMPANTPVKPAPTWAAPTPAPPPTPGVVCTVENNLGCMNETNCGADISKRCGEEAKRGCLFR